MYVRPFVDMCIIVERRRRYNINDRIQELASLLPKHYTQYVDCCTISAMVYALRPTCCGSRFICLVQIPFIRPPTSRVR